MTNTVKHISDAASTVDFNPSGTEFPTNITNVQSALASLGGWTLKVNGLPQSSLTTLGVVQLATLDEVTNGSSETKVPSAKVVNEFVKKPEASESVLGTVQYATLDEAKTTTIRNRVISPWSLDHVFDVRTSTESIQGALRVATIAQARTATDDNVAMTPLKTLAAINTHVKPVADATESSKGISKIATVAEIQAGTAREGVSISPYGFANARATGSAYGTFKAAQAVDMNSLTSVDKAVTPWVLGQTKGRVGGFGLVELVGSKTTGRPNAALSANANVLATTGGDMTGDITYNTTGKGVRWNFATDSAWITFQSTGDSDPNTRMEFAVSDNNTEYFRWISNATAGGGAYEMMRLAPAGPAKKADLLVNGYIYEDGGNRVYSNLNKPAPSTIGAMSDNWGATQLTGYVNNMDGVLDYEVPWHHVMVGLFSYHSDRYEDRQWRVRYKRIG
jgi:hypothetical protein